MSNMYVRHMKIHVQNDIVNDVFLWLTVLNIQNTFYKCTSLNLTLLMQNELFVLLLNRY